MKIIDHNLDGSIFSSSLILDLKNKKYISTFSTKKKFNAKYFLNHCIDSNYYLNYLNDQKKIKKYIKKLKKHIKINDIDLIFTAVNIKENLSHLSVKIDERLSFDAYVTVGVKSNSITSGIDKPSYQSIGTINIIIELHGNLFDFCMNELIMIITEAKTSFFFNNKISSSYSNNIATGTGTDSIVIIKNKKNKGIDYVGNHSLYGFEISKAIIFLLNKSYSKYL
jgi:adenosylcobinamide amidohydrolase